MKKIYQIPEIKVVKIQAAQMIASSLGVEGEAVGTTMLSREGSFFDDDDEDY